MSEPSSPIFTSPANDPDLELAATKARQTFKYFWRETSWENRRIVPGLSVAAIQGKFTDPPGTRSQNPGDFESECMWLLEVGFDGKQIQGALINSPNTRKSVQEGDRLTIPLSQLYDWM